MQSKKTFFTSPLIPSSMEKKMTLSHAQASQRHMRSCHSPMNVKTIHIFHICTVACPVILQFRARDTWHVAREAEEQTLPIPPMQQQYAK